MTRRTFTTTDKNGCEFTCNAYYNGDFEVVDGHCVEIRHDVFEAMGYKADTLEELKQIISNI